MIQGGEDLALFAKAPQDEVGIHTALDQLNRYPLVEFKVGACGFVDSSHASASNLAFNPIGAQTPPDQRIEVFVIIERPYLAKRTYRIQFGLSVQWLFQEVPGAVVLREQCFDIAS